MWSVDKWWTNCNITQHIISAAMISGLYAQHVELLCSAYAKKRDAMLQALDRHLEPLECDAIEWTHPTGGLYVWLTLPTGVDTGRAGPLFHRAIQEGVLFVPGEYCYPNDPNREIPRNTIRLSFGVPNEAQIDAGIAHLARAVQAIL